MEDLDNKSNELIKEILKNYCFFVPYELLEEDFYKNLFSFINVKVTPEFINKYVDKLLYFNEEIEVLKLESYDVIVSYNITKLSMLKNNCFQLMHLRDTIGKSSFKYIFDNYIFALFVGYKLCDIQIANLYQFYPDEAEVLTFIFNQQKTILKTHINDIKENLNYEDTQIDEEKIMMSCINSPLVTPYINEVPSTSEKINNESPKTEEVREAITKPFRDYIIHDKKVEIEKIVKEHFSDLKGINLRYLIEYFVEKEVLIYSVNKTELRKSFIILFENEDVGKYNSIFDIKYFTLNDENYKKNKIVFEKVFENIFKQT